MKEQPVKVDPGNVGDVSRWKTFQQGRNGSGQVRAVERRLSIKNLYAFKVANGIGLV